MIKVQDIEDKPPEFVSVPSVTRIAEDVPTFTEVSYKVQLQWFSFENQQSPIYDMKWGHFDRVNSTFKMLLSSWNFDTVFKKFRSFDAENLGSLN